MPITLVDIGTVRTEISQEISFPKGLWRLRTEVKLERFRLVRVMLLMWLEIPGVSCPPWLCPALGLQGCKEMVKWDLRASCCADLDKNNPGQSCTPFSNSPSVNSALERTEDHLGLCINFLVSFMTATTKFFCVLRCAVSFQIIT